MMNKAQTDIATAHDDRRADPASSDWNNALAKMA
jgi:hypothetical protein